jgi:hypothetical protein
MRTTVLISALVLLLVASVLMMYVTPFGLVNMEAFQSSAALIVPPTLGSSIKLKGSAGSTGATGASGATGAMDASGNEGFESYNLASGGGAGEHYQAMGAFDGVRLSTGNKVSKWRYTAPDEALQGPEFKPGPDSLFMFKNNQCKPECCGASLSCNGGCVCTTPQQRDYLNQRGGNRTAPDDGV